MFSGVKLSMGSFVLFPEIKLSRSTNKRLQIDEYQTKYNVIHNILSSVNDDQDNIWHCSTQENISDNIPKQ